MPISCSTRVIIEGNTIVFTITNSDGSEPEIITPLPLSALILNTSGSEFRITVRRGSLAGDFDSLFIKVGSMISPFVTIQSANYTPPNGGLDLPNGAVPGGKSGGGGCFPGNARVCLKNGEYTTMDKLSIGDEVQVGQGEYSEVFLFTHSLSDAKVTFVKIQSKGGHTICLTPCHMIYVNGELITADMVKPGDFVETLTNSRDVVLQVTRESGVGLYNPHTLSGDLMVNDYHVSTYTKAVSPTLAHALLSPLRFMYKMRVKL